MGTIMMLGMSISTFTTVHVVISLIGIASGLLTVWGMLSGSLPRTMNAIFLVTTILTSVTGFMFPFSTLLPSHIVGAISLVVLAIALLALYVFNLAGPWRWIYVVTAVTALWFNIFVAVVQSFQKLPFLHPLAPTGAEPPFAIAQGIVLLIMIAVGWFSVKRLQPVA